MELKTYTSALSAGNGSAERVGKGQKHRCVQFQHPAAGEAACSVQGAACSQSGNLSLLEEKKISPSVETQSELNILCGWNRPHVTCCFTLRKVELHPYMVQQDMIDFCKAKNIVLTAYSPFGSPERPPSM